MLQHGKRGAPTKFTEAEDKKLIDLVKKYGTRNWNLISKKMRNKAPRQCHARFMNYVNPQLNHGDWTKEDEELLLQKFDEIGPKWTNLASFFKNRPANDVRYKLLRLNRARSKLMNYENDDEYFKTDEQDEPEKEVNSNKSLIDKVFGDLNKEVELLDPNMVSSFAFDHDLLNHLTQ